MVAINVYSDQDGMVPEWRDEHGFTFPILVGADSEKVFSDYRLTSTPLNVLLDPNGKIVKRWEGYRPGAEADIEAAVRKALTAG